MRRHKIKISYFDENCNATTVDTWLPPFIGYSTVAYDGSKNIKAVLLNDFDKSYMKVIFDENSLNFFLENINKIQVPITRMLIYKSFYDMVRDGNGFSSQEYSDFVIKNLPQETSEEIIKSQFSNLNLVLDNFTPDSVKPSLNKKVFDFSIDYLKTIPKENKNRIICVKDNLRTYAARSKSL